MINILLIYPAAKEKENMINILLIYPAAIE